MIGIVGMLARRIGEREHAGDGSAGGAQYPAGHQPEKNLGAGPGKHLEKLAKKSCPSRSNSVHIDLPVLILNPIKTSVGRYVPVDKPSKSAA
jgi:hypothetical protein